MAFLNWFSISVSLAVISVACPLPLQAQVLSAPSRLGEVEKIIVGSSSKLPIQERVRQLELKVFGKSRGGSLESRIKSLESFAGIRNAESMPPLPPQFSKSAKQEKNSPDKEASTLKNGKEALASTSKLEEAVKLHQDGKVIQAEQSLRKILEDNPRSADAYFSLGAIAESRGDMQSALDYYTSAMQANPEDLEARNAVAELSRKLTASRNEEFVNPLLVPANQPTVLQGRAWDLNTSSSTRNQQPFTANVSGSGMQTPTLGVSQNQRQRSGAGSTIARSLARAALSTALSGAGLHCPMCQLLRGF